MSTGAGEIEFLRDTRRRLARLFLAAPAEELARLCAAEVGQVQRVLWASPTLRLAQRDEQDAALLGETGESPQRGTIEPAATGALLAAMLYRPAHELQLEIDWPRVPAWLVKELLAWLVAPVPGFAAAGEGEKYAAHLERTVSQIHRGAVAEPGNPLWGELAEAVVWRLDPTPVYATDANLRTFNLLRADLRQWLLRGRARCASSRQAWPRGGRRSSRTTSTCCSMRRTSTPPPAT
jgi:hypothetical protein